MPLVLGKCTNCGANLEVDNTKDAAICPYCNTPYIVEKAINNYNITNHISANTVNIYGGNSADFVIRAGTLEKYTGAATEVVIPNSVVAIGKEAFKDCKNLVSVTIPDSVTSIGAAAFFGCRMLKSITIPGSVKRIDGIRFAQYGMFSGAFAYSGLESVTLLEGVTSIGTRAFESCGCLENIKIPDSVTSIGYRAFYGCRNLAKVVIPKNVTQIEAAAFESCSSLRAVYILGNPSMEVEEDEETYPYHYTYVFDYCEQLTQIHASEEWKAKNYRHAKCLSSYAPPPTARSSSGCYIATAVYGSYDCPQVWTLRRYRDNILAKTLPGRVFIRIYYSISPALVKCFGNTECFKRIFKHILDKFVKTLHSKGIVDTPYNDKTS